MKNFSARTERGSVELEEIVGSIFGLGVAAAVVCGITYGISSPDHSTDPNEVTSYQSTEVACKLPSQAVPNAASMAVTEDRRIDMIYPCNYFNDMKLPANTKLKLGKMTEEVFDSNVTNGKINGSVGGFAILASGVLKGQLHGKMHSESNRERLYLVNVRDSDGNYVFSTLDKAEKVRVAHCDKTDDTCTPSIEFVTSNEPLWYKEPGKKQRFPLDSVATDYSSIWSTAHGDHEGASLDKRRDTIVKLLTRSDGTPLPPGQAAAELSQEIIITIPE